MDTSMDGYKYISSSYLVSDDYVAWPRCSHSARGAHQANCGSPVKPRCLCCEWHREWSTTHSSVQNSDLSCQVTATHVCDLLLQWILRFIYLPNVLGAGTMLEESTTTLPFDCHLRSALRRCIDRPSGLFSLEQTDGIYLIPVLLL